MKNIKQLMSVVCASLLFSLGTPATAVTIDYSNTAGSTIDFDPDNNCGVLVLVGKVGCFGFTPNSPATSLEITSGTAIGSLGNIDGDFEVGPIAVTGLLETAAVSGVGTLSIDDGAFTLTADLEWVSIFSFGTSGGANFEGEANLSNIVYGGSNADLLALYNGGIGIQTMTYQFGSSQSLTDLFSTGGSTSFSGNITTVPVPAAVWLFGSGLLGLVSIARRKAV